MKKYTLFLLASLISTMAFAQIVSGEITLDSASTMSAEIDIALPFDPLEVENESSEAVFPPYSLNSATYVETGAGAILLCMLAILMGTAVYSYRIRTQKDQ